MIVQPDGSTRGAAFQASRSVPSELEVQKSHYPTEIEMIFKRSALKTKCSSSEAHLRSGLLIWIH